MPCRAILIPFDTNLIDTLEYNQLAGRAGRRGFDPKGTVVFGNISLAKIRTLLFGSLQGLVGNEKIVPSQLLQLFKLSRWDKERARSALEYELFPTQTTWNFDPLSSQSKNNSVYTLKQDN